MNATLPAAAILREWRLNPRRFVRDVFHVTPDSWQDDILEAFGNPAIQRIAVKACKGPGKTAVEAWCAWNFLLTRQRPKIAATSVTGDNLRDNLWTEMAKWQKESPVLLRAFTWGAERIVRNSSPETVWMSARTWARSATPEQQGQTLAGLHEDEIMFILDEAGSIPDSVAKTAMAALANAEPGSGREAKLLLSGNPDEPEGPLYRAFQTNPEGWWLYSVTGDPDDPKRAPRVSVTWARQMIAEYGREDPWVMANILGQFPKAGSMKFIPRDLIDAAAGRHLRADAYDWAPRVLGVDVARFGQDRSVVFPRQGLAAFPPIVVRHFDTMEVVDVVVGAIKSFNPAVTFVDVSGGLGAGPHDRLKQLGYKVMPVEFAGKTAHPRAHRKRDELYFNILDWLKDGGAIPNIPELIAELAAPNKIYIPGSGKQRVQEKDDLRDILGRSPDLSDALGISMAFPVRLPDTPEERMLARSGDKPKGARSYDPRARRRVA